MKSVQAAAVELLRKHRDVVVRQDAKPGRSGVVTNERACEGCGHKLSWHSWRDDMAAHQVAMLDAAGLLAAEVTAP